MHTLYADINVLTILKLQNDVVIYRMKLIKIHRLYAVIKLKLNNQSF